MLEIYVKVAADSMISIIRVHNDVIIRAVYTEYDLHVHIS